MKRIIMKVWRNKLNKQLLVTIPKDSGIKAGDHVEIKLVKWLREVFNMKGKKIISMPLIVILLIMIFYLIGKEYLRVVDIAASTLILREAGGIVTNIFGEELDMAFDLNEHTSVVAACNMDIVKKIIS